MIATGRFAIQMRRLVVVERASFSKELFFSCRMANYYVEYLSTCLDGMTAEARTKKVRQPGIEPGTNRLLHHLQSAALPTELSPVTLSLAFPPHGCTRAVNIRVVYQWGWHLTNDKSRDS